MKRLALAALAAAMFAAPLAIATPAAADDDHRGRRHRHHDDWSDRDDDHRRHRRESRRWDDRHFNGYWHDNRWYYGPPPRDFRGDYSYDYRAWRRGDRLPRYYRDHYREVDWRHHRLRAPPRGYHYVYDDDRDEYLLIGIATGVILGVILSN